MLLSVKAFCTLEFVAWHIFLCYSDPFWHNLRVICYLRAICYLRFIWYFSRIRVFCSLYVVACACSPTEPIPTIHFYSGPSRCIFRLAACVWVIRVSLFHILLQNFLQSWDFPGGCFQVFFPLGIQKVQRIANLVVLENC